MKPKRKVSSHERSQEDLEVFIKKLELQALETSEERIPPSLFKDRSERGRINT